MAVKTRDNLLSKITLRETTGSFQRSSLFRRCPGRFCVPLRSLVAEEQLQRGHVFLGFTKCGQYMLSYQLNVLPQYSFPLLLFQYTLHWWQFCLRKPLKLIHSVPLFVGEEIDSDLHLIVSQSMDESKVVVCGICHGNKEEPSHMCYITICAAPPRRPCSKCRECFPHAISGQTPPCLEHSFAVHFKYSLLSPFPLFNPSICLQMDGVVLFNTTDSLLALNVVASSAEEERKFCRKLPFKLKETFECCDSSQSIHSSSASSQNLPNSAEEVVPAVHELEDDENIPSMTADDASILSMTADLASSSHVTVDHGNISSMTAGDASVSSAIADDRNISSMTAGDASVSSAIADDRNISNMTADDTNVSSVTADDGTASSVTADDRNISNMTADDANVSSMTADDGNVSSVTGDDANVSSMTADDGNISSMTADDANVSTATAVSGTLHDTCTELVQLRSCDEQSAGNEFIPEGPQSQVLEKTDQEQSTANSAVRIGDKGCERPQCYSSEKSEICCGECRDHPNSSGECINEEQRIKRGAGTDFRPNEEVSYAALTVCSQVESEGSDYHRRNRDSLPGPERLDSSLDGSTTSLEVEPERVLTTCSCKVFTEDLFSQGSVEDTGTFYELETVLPVTVTKLPASTPLSCVCVHDAQSSYTAFENDFSRYTSPFVIISQVSLDLEKCICELVESHEALRTRYKSLRDYDTEIIAVCPHTAEVIVLMKILVYARGPGTTSSFGLPVSPRPSLKSTGFVFSWNIHTGQVKSLHNMALHDFSEKKHNFKFNLAASEAAELWRKVAVPCGIGSRVQAFSNHTVFGGKSLKYLKHPNLPFAVVLQ